VNAVALAVKDRLEKRAGSDYPASHAVCETPTVWTMEAPHANI